MEGSWGCPGRSGGRLGRVLGALGASRGRLGSLLGASWGALGPIFSFLIDFGTEKGAQREAFWEPKCDQNRSENEVENEDGKKTFLGASWVDFGSFWEGVGRPFLLIFYWFFYYFKENDVFEKDRCPRAILEPSGTQKGPKRHPKREPKRTQKATQNEVDILIDFRSIFDPILTPKKFPHGGSGDTGRPP